MLFDLTHNLYMIISALISIAILILASVYIKDEKAKKRVLKFFAIITVILHYSILWVDFFKAGEAKVQSVMLLAVHPCNVIMWLLLISAFVKDHNKKPAQFLYEFTFYAGVVCGIIGILLNENYASNPTLLNYNVLKGLLSHSTMIVGCVYILVGKFIKIRVKNVISVFMGLCLFLVNGHIINELYLYFNLGEANSMYLQAVPFDNLPWFNTYLMGVIGLVLVFAFTVIYEWAFVEKEQRWYKKIKNNLEERIKNEGFIN